MTMSSNSLNSLPHSLLPANSNSGERSNTLAQNLQKTNSSVQQTIEELQQTLEHHRSERQLVVIQDFPIPMPYRVPGLIN